jgi:F-type H+-transporting ATPase subunit a
VIEEKKTNWIGTIARVYRNHVWLRWVTACILLQILIGIFFVRPDLSESVHLPKVKKDFFGLPLPCGGYHPVTVTVTWAVMALWIGLACFLRVNLREKPGRVQMALEKFVAFLHELCEDTLGHGRGKMYVPFIGSIFLMVWGSNLTTVIPIPHMEEPTANANFTVGLATIALCVAHFSAIYTKGIGEWLHHFYFKIPLKKWNILPFLLIFYFKSPLKKREISFSLIIPNPLELVGELSKPVSHSMRLFGNIFGGAIIMTVISKLAFYVVLPALLVAYFGIFIGTVQAFVFSMLALVYIAVLSAEH